jgi:hypothetical protein
MKHSALLVFAMSLVACASESQLTNTPLERCESTDCFNQQQIRDFEVIDNTTLLVYVGSQNCAFRVEFTGIFCDLTFLPGGSLVFRPDTFRSSREPDNILVTRVCARDSNLGIDEGPFSTAAGGDNDPRIPCRISNIVSMTDDEVLELYVDKQIASPPPPFGTGQIVVPDESQSSSGDNAAGEGPETDSNTDGPNNQGPPTAAN